MDDDFEEHHPGRRMVATYPDDQSGVCRNCSTITCHTITILDAPSDYDVSVPCAAMIVPSGLEESWVYSSPGGQWQLLASAGVSRLILISKSTHFKECKVTVEPCFQDNEAINFRNKFENLVKSLAPLSCYTQNFAVPFVNYTDNVLQCVKIEEVESPLTGAIVVEDVELTNWDDNDEVDSKIEIPKRSLEKISSNEKSAAEPSKNKTPERIFRRRLRFKRMPNLIQSEVPLLIHPSKTNNYTNESKKSIEDSRINTDGSFMSNDPINDQNIPDDLQLHEVQRIPDYSNLVHKYLIPMLSGLYLISPYLNFSMSTGYKTNVLVIGGGACTLPIFFRLHFPFHIQVVELDQTVISLAERHFHLIQDEKLKVIIGDGLEYIHSLANQISSIESTYKKSHARFQKPKLSNNLLSFDEDIESNSSTFKNDLAIRISILVIDVDVDDGRLSLSAPPMDFLEKKFLILAKSVMESDGILIMNVMPWGKLSYDYTINALKEVFEVVYECVVEGDMNFVLYAMSKPYDVNTLTSRLGNVHLPIIQNFVKL